jgi:hypothetical protein
MRLSVNTQLLRRLAEQSLNDALTACMIEDLKPSRLSGADAMALADIVGEFFEAVDTIERDGTL